MPIPRIISVDDHIVEPPDLWQSRLPAKYKHTGPRVKRAQGEIRWDRSASTFVESDGPDSAWTDLWLYEDLVWPLARGWAQSGYDSENSKALVTYDDVLPAVYQQGPRLAAMTENHTDASLTFPTFSRFCGQTFLEAKDKVLAKLCVEAYNDFMIEEWGGGDGRGRLIPLTLIPLWDIDLAVAEVRRCAEKGSHALSFSEQPADLGLPSVHSGYWDPLWAVCEETATVVNMHIGSSSNMPTTSEDAPQELFMTLNAENAQHALGDWLTAGVFVRYPKLKMALSEGQVGWMPYFLQRLDQEWEKSDIFAGLKDRVPEPPSRYVAGRVYGCIFDDQIGLRMRDVVGLGQIMFETDFPHSDSTYPRSKEVAEKLVAAAELSDRDAWLLLRGNAIECYGLERWGVTD